MWYDGDYFSCICTLILGSGIFLSPSGVYKYTEWVKIFSLIFKKINIFF